MAADVASFIRHHQLTKPTLIGHSMCVLLPPPIPAEAGPTRSQELTATREPKRGAKTAMTLALQEPDTVHDLVSVDNAPIDAVLGSDFGRYVQAMRKIEAAAVTKQAEADKILEPYEPVESIPPCLSLCARPGPNLTNAGGQNVTIRQFLLGNLHRPRGADDAKTTLAFRVPLGVLGRALDHMGDFPFRDAAAARFPGRALFVRGTRSRYVADESIPAIGAFFPRFELVDVDAGHWLISESPEEFRRGTCVPARARTRPCRSGVFLLTCRVRSCRGLPGLSGVLRTVEGAVERRDGVAVL